MHWRQALQRAFIPVESPIPMEWIRQENIQNNNQNQRDYRNLPIWIWNLVATLAIFNMLTIAFTLSLQALCTEGNPSPTHKQENQSSKNTNSHTRPGGSTKVGGWDNILNLWCTRHSNHCEGEDTHPESCWQQSLWNISLLEYNSTKRVHNESNNEHAEAAIGQSTTAQQYCQNSTLFAQNLNNFTCYRGSHATLFHQSGEYSTK